MRVSRSNGSPRKKGATATYCGRRLAARPSRGAEIEFIHLDGLVMKAAMACYSCKKRGGKSYGRCVLRDDMTQPL